MTTPQLIDQFKSAEISMFMVSTRPARTLSYLGVAAIKKAANSRL
jgi:hypothetical protein